MADIIPEDEWGELMVDDTYLERGEKIAQRCVSAIRALKRHPIRLLSVKEVLIETDEYAVDEILELLTLVHKQCAALTLFNQRTRSKTELLGARRVQQTILERLSDWNHLQRLSISGILRYPEILYKWLYRCPNIQYLHMHCADRRRKIETTL